MNQSAGQTNKTVNTAAARPLRFITCGSVDDGKSTLIGRLLYDSKALMLDQLDALASASKKRSGGRSEAIDLSLATDGLEAEREQGITIDVAYRYFATPRRKFIIADAPGHEQYTRNMVTGASKSDVAVILVDVTKLDFSTSELTLLTQTKRHAAIVGLLGIEHVVLAANKMDAIDFDAAKFDRVVKAFAALADTLSLPKFTAVPVSALDGDGIVAHTDRTAWFKGLALLPLLESIELGAERQQRESNSYVAVQYVTRDATDDHRRWFAGDVSGAPLALGTEIQIHPSGAKAVVVGLNTARGAVSIAQPGEAVTLQLDRQLDVSRGDWICALRCGSTAAPATRHVTATLAWLDSAPLNAQRRLLARHGTRWIPARIIGIRGRLDLTAGRWQDDPATGSGASEVSMNDLVRVDIEFASEVATASYGASKERGAFVLIDPSTNATAAAGLIT